MRHTNTHILVRAKKALSAWTVACIVLTLARGPSAMVQTAEAASSFRPTIFVNTEAFLIIDDDDTTADVVMRFGDTLAKTLSFNRSLDRFQFNDDVYVTGTVQATGTVSGAVVYGAKSLRSSGSLVWEGAASGSSLHVSNSFIANGSSIVGSLAQGNVLIVNNNEVSLNSTTHNVQIGDAQGSGNGTVFSANDASQEFTFLNGNVGIGASNPQGLLHVTGNGGKAILDTGTSNGNVSLSFVDGGSEKAHVSLDQNTATFDIGSAGRVTVNSSDYVTISGSNYTNIQGSTTFIGNNVGIGKSDPKTRLDVVGAISGSFLYATQSFSGAGLTDCDGGTSKLLWDATTGRFSCGTVTSTAYTAGQGLTLNGTSFRLNTTVTGSLASFTTVSGSTVKAKDLLTSSGAIHTESGAHIDGNTLVVQSGNNRVGIGTGDPDASLDVVGTISGSLVTQNGAGNNSFMGNVGFGTTTPDTLLYAKGANPHFTFENTTDHTGKSFFGTFNDATRTLIQLSANRKTSDGSVPDATRAPAYMDIVSTAGNGYIDFSTTTVNGGSPSTAMRVNGNGNIGIGTSSTTPDTKLEVAGAISGSFIYATRSFSGAGLSDCDTAGTSKLLWDATTGRFSCGTDTDTNTTYTAGQGLALNGTSFRLNATVTGSVIKATTSLASSGTLVWEGAASGSTLTVSTGLTVHGDAIFGTDTNDALTSFANTTFMNGVTLGSDSSDTIMFGGQIGTALMPSANQQYNVGDPSGFWNYGYFTNLNILADIYAEGNISAYNLRTRGVANCNGANALATDVDGTIYCDIDDNTGYDDWGSGNFSITDGSTTETINSGDQITFADGTGINVVVSASDTVTINSSNLYANDMNQNVGTDDAPLFAAARVRGVLSGVTLYATKSFSGAGLTDCDTGGTSKLLWDATTGRFSCGTDSGATYTAGQGLTLNGTSFRVNTTLTGSLAEFSTVSGAIVHAQSALRSSGALVADGDAFLNANLNVLGTTMLGDGDTDNLSLLGDINSNISVDSNNTFNFGNSSNRWASGWFNSANVSSDLSVLGTSSLTGNVGIGPANNTTKAVLNVSGVMSGITLYATKSFSGAGLTDCDTGGTSKLLWDATTGRFSCGTDSGATYTAGQGLTLNGSAFSLSSSISGTLLEFQTVSGAVVYAERQLSVSGSVTLGEDAADNVVFNADVNSAITPNTNNSFDFGGSSARWATGWFNSLNTSAGISVLGTSSLTGNVGIGSANSTTKAVLAVTGTISGATVYATRSFSGAGLSDCDTAGTSKLLWDATTGRFSCGTDANTTYTAGQGLTLNGTSFRLNATVTGSVIQAANTIASSGTLVWEGAASGASLVVSNATSLKGNVALGDNAGDTITFNGLVNSTVTPSANNTYDFGSSSARWAAGWFNSMNISAGLSVAGTTGLTGNVGIGSANTTTKAVLNVSGVMSGITLYATRSFSGAGLSDCDTASSKLLWDATTGRFSCGTVTTSNWSNTGSLQTYFDNRYVNTSGDTMTGALTVQNGTVHAATTTPLINVRGTMSGRGLTISGSGASPLLSTLLGKPAVRIGGSGSLVIETRSSDPGSAPANTVGIFAQKTAGRPMLMQASGATMAATALQTALFGNQIMLIKPGGGSTLTVEGTQALNDTTVSHPAADQVFGFMANFATAATSGDEAGTSSSNTAAFRGSTAGANGFFYMARVGAVDATSIRVFSGMADQTIATMVGADNPAGNFAGFQFSTPRTDSNWQFTTKDNTTQNVVNTGMAFSANKVYDLYFMCTKQCAAITWEIRNVTDGTSAAGTTSSNLPTTTAALRMVLGVESQTTAAKNIRMQQMYFESDR